MRDEIIFFQQLIKNDLGTADNISKITTSQGDDCTTGCLLDYPNFEKYRLIAIDNLIEETKETVLDSS